MSDEQIPQPDPTAVPKQFQSAPPVSPPITPSKTFVQAAKADGVPVMETTDGNYYIVAVTEETYKQLKKINEAKNWDLRIRDVPVMSI